MVLLSLLSPEKICLTVIGIWICLNLSGLWQRSKDRYSKSLHLPLNLAWDPYGDGGLNHNVLKQSWKRKHKVFCTYRDIFFFCSKSIIQLLPKWILIFFPQEANFKRNMFFIWGCYKKTDILFNLQKVLKNYVFWPQKWALLFSLLFCSFYFQITSSKKKSFIFPGKKGKLEAHLYWIVLMT